MPESVQDIKGNEYVNHSGSGNPSVTPMTPMTPMTPASDCPLLLTGDGRVSQTHASPYERPYSTLGDLKPLHLISFAYQIASGMVSYIPNYIYQYGYIYIYTVYVPKVRICRSVFVFMETIVGQLMTDYYG